MRSTLTRRALAAFAAVATSTALAAPAAGAQSLSFEIGAGVATPCQTANSVDMEQIVDDIHEHTNLERAEVGAAPVQRLDSLEEIAQDWSSQMASDDWMRHNPDIRARVSQTYPGQWRSYGENVLQNWCGASGEKLVEQWMRSPGHRLNLLNPAHTHLGVGAAVADSSKLYSTQNFVRLR